MYGQEHPNPLTLADLKEALKGLATQEDLKALPPQETVNAIRETVAETKEGMTCCGLIEMDTLIRVRGSSAEVSDDDRPTPDL